MDWGPFGNIGGTPGRLGDGTTTILGVVLHIAACDIICLSPSSFVENSWLFTFCLFSASFLAFGVTGWVIWYLFETKEFLLW